MKDFTLAYWDLGWRMLALILVPEICIRGWSFFFGTWRAFVFPGPTLAALSFAIALYVYFLFIHTLGLINLSEVMKGGAEIS